MVRGRGMEVVWYCGTDAVMRAWIADWSGGGADAVSAGRFAAFASPPGAGPHVGPECRGPPETDPGARTGSPHSFSL